MDFAGYNKEVFVAIVSGTLIFLVFSGFLIAYILIYRNRRLKHAQELQRVKDQFEQEMLKSRIEVQEQILGNVSREIHDNVGQILSLAKVEANILQASGKQDAERLSSLKGNIGKAIDDLRAIAKSLSGQGLGVENFPEMINAEAQRLNSTGIISVSVQCQGTPRSLDPQKALVLYRVVQECLQNIVRHAGASEAVIQLHHLEQHFHLSVRDNGCGFDPNQMGAFTGIGLQNIFTRAKLMGAACDIVSSPGQGCVVELKLPYE